MTLPDQADIAEKGQSMSTDIYGIHDWGDGLLRILENGHIGLCHPQRPEAEPTDLLSLVENLSQRGIATPVLIRVTDFLKRRIEEINLSFADAISEMDYKGRYQGVFPIKVNQQAEVIERIADYGHPYNFGFEVGSKAELLIALSLNLPAEAAIICNGIKDSEFLNLAASSLKLGFNIFIVLESPRELELVLDVVKNTDVRPQLGVRIKLTNTVSGNWAESSGDRSTFGLTIAQIMDVIETLKAEGYLDCLCLQHSHLGSQVPNIIEIRKSVQEACQFFAELRREGVPLRYLDLGGGLGIDYTGEKTASANSINYTLREYCLNIIETVKDMMDVNEVEHPVIITESGRACVAQSSLLIFNVLEATHFDSEIEVIAQDDDHTYLLKMLEIQTYLTRERVQECWNDLKYYRDEIRALFRRNQVSLAVTARSERAYLYLIMKIKQVLRDPEAMTEDMKQALVQVADIYHCNFSLFQSLPDVWAIDQIHPLAPLQRLHEPPQRVAILSDITCDSDGKIDKFVLGDGVSDTLPVHDLKADEDYFLGVFFIGAYQETLGDLHNLFGDTNVVTIGLDDAGGFEILKEQDGDTIYEVLSYVEYEPKRLLSSFKAIVETAVKKGKVSPADRRQMIKAYTDSLNGYTYFEHSDN